MFSRLLWRERLFSPITGSAIWTALQTMAVKLQRPHAAVACLLLCYLSGGLSIPDPRQREALIKLETSMQTGGQEVLTDAEQRLDAILDQMKQVEVTSADFPPAMHFFKARALIRSSPVFSLLQKMPKGMIWMYTNTNCMRLEKHMYNAKPFGDSESCSA